MLVLADILNRKLAEIAHCFVMPLTSVREGCLLYRKQPTSQTHWEKWNELHRQLSHQFYPLIEAVGEALLQPPRASSLVENLKS